MTGLVDRIIQDLYVRRDKILRGEVNCIRSPFKRFSSQFPGIEQGVFYLISGASKSSKTQIMNYLFLYTAILYGYNHPDIVTPKIFYYPLEEKKEKVTTRFMCYLLYTICGIRCSPKDLSSTSNENPVSEDTLNSLKTTEILDILRYYEEHVEFKEAKNPTGIWKDITKYAEENGTIHKKEYTTKDIDGNIRKGYSFDYYTPNNPNEYVMWIVDHVSIIETERDFTLKKSIDKLCEYFILARNKYNYIPIICQQQNIETIGLEAFKSNKIRPTLAGLADSKDTGKAIDIMLGITNPFAFELPKYLNYDITKLKGNFRCLEVVLNRGGESNSICPLYFDGAVNYYRELPLPTSPDINKVYKFIEESKKHSLMNMILTTFNKMIKK